MPGRRGQLCPKRGGLRRDGRHAAQAGLLGSLDTEEEETFQAMATAAEPSDTAPRGGSPVWE